MVPLYVGPRAVKEGGEVAHPEPHDTPLDLAEQAVTRSADGVTHVPRSVAVVGARGLDRQLAQATTPGIRSDAIVAPLG